MRRRIIYENGSPIFVPDRVETKRDDREYMTTNFSGMDPRYLPDSYTGYISVPIGDLDFMTTTKIQERTVHNYYTAYNVDSPEMNRYNYPTFIKTENAKGAKLHWTWHKTFNSPILGHFVFPVFRKGTDSKYFRTSGGKG